MDAYEEWRLILEVGKGDGIDDAIAEALTQVADDVDIHRRGEQVLIYAFTQAAAWSADELVSDLLGWRGLPAAPTLTRWNPGAERWQDPSLPVEPPRHAIGPDWAELGELAWEVRVRSQSRGEARDLAEELLADGYPTITGVRNRVTVGVADESSARALANELRVRAPTAEIAVRALSRWRRWLIRQRLLGNYGGGGDGGGAGGDFGGGGGDGGGA